MKEKKSIGLSLLLIIALVTASIFTVFAATSPTVYAEKVSCEAGNTVKIPVVIKNNTGLAGVKLKFNYDETKLTPINVESGYIFNSGLQDNIEGDAGLGSFNVYWASPTGDNVSSNGVLFYLNFNINDTAYGETQISVSYDQADTFDENFNDVFLECKSIDIQIENASLLNKIHISSSAIQNNNLGERYVDINLHINNLKKSEDFDLSLNYDSSIFSFYDVYGNISTLNNNPGILKFNVQADETANDTDFIMIRLEYKEDVASGNYLFNIFSEDQNILCESCQISLKAQENTENTKIYIPKGIVVENGKTVSVPVMINNNKGIMGYRLKFDYNPSELQIVSVSNGEGFEGNVNDSIGNEVGKFDVVWSSTEDKTSNGILLYLNIVADTSVLDRATESLISISYDSGDTFNEDYDDVAFDCTNGIVTICPVHTYTKTIINPECLEIGYTSYKCKYCSQEHFDDYKDPIGHYFVYQKDPSSVVVNSYDMYYECKDCGEIYNTTGDEVFNVFSNQYYNTLPSRNDLNSQLLDVNHDDFINAKDYAMIIHAHNSK